MHIFSAHHEHVSMFMYRHVYDLESRETSVAVAIWFFRFVTYYFDKLKKIWCFPMCILQNRT
jgi:hypothetical protein